jgi:hypothetical protein
MLLMSHAGLEPATHWLKAEKTGFYLLTATTFQSLLLQVAAASKSISYYLFIPLACIHAAGLPQSKVLDIHYHYRY